VCDPYTQMCVAGECDTNQANCPSNKVCLGQVQNPNVGACYNECTAFSTTSGCTASQFCLPVTDATNAGACFTVGTGALNSTCTPSAVSTGCVTGAACANDGLANPVCRKICDFWTAPAGCGTGTRCVAGNLCSSQTPDPAAIGATCATTSMQGTGCAPNTTSVTGVCVTVGTTLTCAQWCRLGGTDCTSAQTCTSVGNPDVGVCQ
jgi:hypothetical protein